MQDLPFDLHLIDIVEGLKIYWDQQMDQLLYYYNDHDRESWMYYYIWHGLFYEQDGVVFNKPLWLEVGETENGDSDVYYQDHYSYYYYPNGDDRVEISESNYRQYQEEYLGQYTLIAEDVPSHRADETIIRAGDDELRAILLALCDALYPFKPDVGAAAEQDTGISADDIITI